eukprot:6471461-Amphidinium_carterae.1
MSGAASAYGDEDGIIGDPSWGAGLALDAGQASNQPEVLTDDLWQDLADFQAPPKSKRGRPSKFLKDVVPLSLADGQLGSVSACLGGRGGQYDWQLFSCCTTSVICMWSMESGQ